ncbi:HEPN domain-containing protein [Methanobacterium sp.]|uniref:HEPN domain-containing protein n=1 Tax=Methanobacterium sp. TaxID=2164 RepID=UPI00315941F4
MKLLIKNSDEKLLAAKTLFENGFYGDAVSRAYYAMFFVTKALLSKKDSYPRTHRGLISQFGLLFVKKGEFKKELFDLLTRAQEDREEADYGLFLELDKEESLIIIKGAELFLEECKLILSNL